MRPVATPGPPLRDFEAYYAAGATWRAGGDPYSRDIWRVERRLPGVVATRDELLPFIGPPYSLPLWGAVSALPFGTAVVTWGGVLAAAALLLVAGSARLARIRGGTELAATAALACAFGPLTSAFALGQVALVSCAGIVAVVLALASVRTRLAVAAVAALAAALQPNLACALMARLTDRRARFALIVAAAAALVLALAAQGGVAPFARYVALLAAHTRAESGIAIQTTVGAVAAGFGAQEPAARALAIGTALAVIAATGWLLRSPRYAPEARVAVACAALPLALPFSHEHDLTIAFFPAVLCLRSSSARAWCAAACATTFVAVDWLGLAQRPGGLAQSIALAAAWAFASIALARTLGPLAIAPFAVVACAIVAGVLAGAHPLPVWPYALPEGFRVAAGEDAAGVWRLEQAASGLAQPGTLSAALRALSLAGCAGLWATSLVALRGGVSRPLRGTPAARG